MAVAGAAQEFLQQIWPRWKSENKKGTPPWSLICALGWVDVPSGPEAGSSSFPQVSDFCWREMGPWGWVRTRTRWCFHIFLVFIPTWGNDPSWLIFFRWVETTNQFFETFNNFWIFFFLQKEVSETTFCRKNNFNKVSRSFKNNFSQKKQFYKVSRSFKNKFRGETVEKIKCYIYIRYVSLIIT